MTCQAAFDRFPAQDLVGVHRDRVRDVLEQGRSFCESL